MVKIAIILAIETLNIKTSDSEYENVVKSLMSQYESLDENRLQREINRLSLLNDWSKW